MKVQLFYNRVVMVTAGIEIDLLIFFKCVDVVEHEEWLCCENAYAVTIFSVDNVKSYELFCIPAKPLFKTGGSKLVRQSFPYSNHQWLFSHNDVIIGEAEAMKVPYTTCRWDCAKYPSTL